MKLPRGVLALVAVACLVASAIIPVATPLSARADDLLDDHQHMPLINIGSGKCFEPIGGSSDWAGLPIQQRTCSPHVIRHEGDNDRPIQYYQFQDQGVVDFNDQGGWFGELCNWLGCIHAQTTGYLIRNLDTNLCLDARDGARTDGSVVQQWTCGDRNARSMMWYVQPGDWPDMFKVRNFNSDLCLDVRGAPGTKTPSSSSTTARRTIWRRTLAKST